MKILAITSLLTGLAFTANADILATFSEGAPKDRFTFQNTSDCALSATTLTLNLADSAGKLVFDVTGSGAGVEVFQPFELVSGGQSVSQSPSVLDGDKALTLTLTELPSQAKVAFTIDVDDTLGQREITVNSSEISGAMVKVQTNGAIHSSKFEGTTARVSVPCAS